MKTIVAAVDFSDVTDIILEKAVEFASAIGANVVLFHVSPLVEPWVDTTFETYTIRNSSQPEYAETEAKRREMLLDAMRDSLRARGVRVEVRLAIGQSPAAIGEALDALQPDLIVIGSHRHGAFRELLLGSVCPRVVRSARCPVLVVHPGDASPLVKERVSSPCTSDATAER